MRPAPAGRPSGRAAGFGNESGDARGDQREQREGENQPESHGCGDRMLRVRSYIQFTMFRRRKPRGLRSARPTLMVLRQRNPLKHAVRDPAGAI